MDKQTHVALLREKSEPTLSIGDTVETEEGVSGVVIAKFFPRNEPSKRGYILEKVPAHKAVQDSTD